MEHRMEKSMKNEMTSGRVIGIMECRRLSNYQYHVEVYLRHPITDIIRRV